jgi:hypothetical protein
MINWIRPAVKKMKTDQIGQTVLTNGELSNRHSSSSPPLLFTCEKYLFLVLEEDVSVKSLDI